MAVNKAKILAIVNKNLNIGGLFADTLDEVLEPVLRKFVADSANPYDDMLMAAIYPVLEKELKEYVAEQLNKLFEAEEVVAE